MNMVSNPIVPMADLILADARTRNTASRPVAIAFHAHRLIGLPVEDLQAMLRTITGLKTRAETPSQWSPLTLQQTADMLELIAGLIIKGPDRAAVKAAVAKRLNIDFDNPLLKACLRHGACPGMTVTFTRITESNRIDTVEIVAVEMRGKEPIFHYLNEYGNLRWALLSAIHGE